jgi:transketolase
VVAIDGGSTDGTIEFFKQHGVPVIGQSRRGRGDAFIQAFEKIDADAYIFFSPDGNEAIDAAIQQNTALHKPMVIIADTVKGKGVRFMEKMAEDGFYKFHAGTLTEAQYAQAKQEYIPALQKQCEVLGLSPLDFVEVDFEFTQTPKDQQELVRAYGQELVELGKSNPDFMVLDGDLIRSCGLIPFSKAFPDRFLECGIAEQDMISIGSGLAMGGITPIMHSLGCFLSTRPNEQIYNAATEQPAPGRKKMIYFGSGAGILPAGPGHSHQEVRAIASVGAIPGLALLEPANEQEMKQAIRWALNVNQESTYLRVSSVKKAHNFEIDNSSELECGKGRWVRKAEERVIITFLLVPKEAMP